MLVSHRPSRDSNWAVIQRADKRVNLGSQRWLCQLFRKAPQFTTARDRPFVVQEHAVRVAAPSAAERDGYHLAALGVVAEAVRIRHADEFVFDQRLALVNKKRAPSVDGAPV